MCFAEIRQKVGETIHLKIFFPRELVSTGGVGKFVVLTVRAI
jgi:hypothetical protein